MLNFLGFGKKEKKSDFEIVEEEQQQQEEDGNTFNKITTLKICLFVAVKLFFIITLRLIRRRITNKSYSPHCIRGEL